MADPSTYRPRTGDIPTSPGVYRFSDPQGRVIYVGKAKNLRNRLTNYFQDLANLHPRTQQMVTTASRVQWTVVRSEIEALTLEFTWIKEFNPRFNVVFKDDKSYPYLAVSMGERYPRVQVTRERKRAGSRYFGPYTQVWAIRETIDQLLRVFPVRSCSAGVFARAKAQGRPCLLGYIDKCSAPCVERVTAEEHRELAEGLCRFMQGRTGPVIRDLETQMREASANLDFERAAKLRDDVAALRTVLERNAVVLDDGADADVFALVSDDLDAAVHVFHVRGGRIRGTRGWVIERVDGAGDAALMSRLLEQVYSSATEDEARGARETKAAAVSVDDVAHTPTSAIPREVLVSVAPDDMETISRWLGEARGASVAINVPKRGPKAQLMDTVTDNARQALTLHRTRRAGDITARSKALEQLAENLDLPAAPLRIECYDVSHTGGENQVASMVVFTNGRPDKGQYRRFKVRSQLDEANDFVSMGEVLGRRYAPERMADERFGSRPDLLVVDGGKPQLTAALRQLGALGLDIPVCGLAKSDEEVFVPWDDTPVVLPSGSPSLYLIKQVRDESHRFAITFHRELRTKAQSVSVLDDVEGVGPKRKRAILRRFGSLKGLRAASVDQVAEVEGLPRSVAEEVWQTVHAWEGEGASLSPETEADAGGAPGPSSPSGGEGRGDGSE